MIRIIFIAFVFQLIGCSSQKLYSGVIYIYNPCDYVLGIMTSNDGGYLVPNGGNISLNPGERKPWIMVDLSRRDQNFNDFFSGNKNFEIRVLGGGEEVEFTGGYFINLSRNISSIDDWKSDYVIYEVNNVTICPAK